MDFRDEILERTWMYSQRVFESPSEAMASPENGSKIPGFRNLGIKGRTLADGVVAGVAAAFEYAA